MHAALGKSMRKRYGEKRKFSVVEDGDTKGFQSSKGKQAKLQEHIRSWMLPPRSLGLMPLDYCLWNEMEDRALSQNGHEQIICMYPKTCTAASVLGIIKILVSYFHFRF